MKSTKARLVNVILAATDTGFAGTAGAFAPGVLIRLAAALVLVAGFASSALANQIQVGYAGSPNSPYGPYQTGQGGEFTLNDVNGTIGGGDWLDLSGYVSGKTSNFPIGGTITSFQSFCIERNEYLNAYSATYNAVVSGAAVNGGVDGGNPDPISQGTALLYSLFAQGTLTGYNYTGTEAQREASAALLQQAFWWLENELTSYTPGNTFITLVATAFGSAANARNDATGDRYGVSVLNLTTPGGVKGQDQLYYRTPISADVSVPDGGATMALLGMGLLGLGVVARRIRRIAGIRQ